MRLKDRINEMIEQYSITHDNPTVLRELRKLSALTAVVIEWIENNDPADFTKDIAAINARMDEIENLVNSLHLETIVSELEELRASVNAVSGKADSAIATANQSVNKAEAALTAATSVETDLNAFKEKTTSDLDTIDQSITEINTKVSDADTKAEAAMALADAADTNSSSAVAKAESAVTKADTALRAAGTASTAAENAMSKAEAVEAMLDSKQNTLTFDQAPTENSLNPVTSDGIYKAMKDIPSGGEITLDDTVTENSSNGVKSSGIYLAIENARTSLKNMIDAANIVIASHTDNIAALKEFQQTQEVTNETHNTQIAANKTAIDGLTRSKQDQLKTGEANISTDVITSMDDTEPEDGKLATAKAVWERIESKGSGGGSITYTGVKFKFPENNIITLPSNFVPVFYMMIIESGNDNYDKLYVNGFAPYYVSGLYPLAYLQNNLIATKTDFRGGNVIGFDIFTSKNLLNFTTNNRVAFISANISSIMLSSGEKPFTPLEPPSDIIIYGFYL